MAVRRHSKAAQLQWIVDEYVRDRGVTEIDPDELTEWAINKRYMERDAADFYRRCKKDLTKAMRDRHHTDPQGREVRTMIAVKIKGEKRQQSLWFELLEAKPKRAHTALAQQRRNIVAFCRKHKDATDSYNDNNKFGAVLPLFDYDINKDLAEGQMPTEYPDEKPDEEG